MAGSAEATGLGRRDAQRRKAAEAVVQTTAECWMPCAAWGTIRGSRGGAACRRDAFRDRCGTARRASRSRPQRGAWRAQPKALFASAEAASSR